MNTLKKVSSQCRKKKIEIEGKSLIIKDSGIIETKVLVTIKEAHRAWQLLTNTTYLLLAAALQV
jgi:hypothetical protein